MTPEIALDLFRQAQFLIVMMVVVIIGPGLLVGLLVAVFQAATQINEQTLSFLPRLLTTLLTIVFAGPWLLQQIMELATSIIFNIPVNIG
ncbi:flagellar biosynthesis protein FliQ [Endozoicomonas montiporae]|uniref:Flagellar biosynthesis protein FliQ n=2 Tax=Endozoicomonas montiporae TaxID=1027273 RepID=A0A081NC51_9GAMM|nr:flagellar biosynthetic protein FliQ [Endozoicomonas montiporae]AMO56351.1 flagellar biosynthetic protein FliQ [Endozoicomonas montiporae CL-33]KEQ16024.1 flagellar biosynthesis protein FliQ [Endozoicomonas montiporae]